MADKNIAQAKAEERRAMAVAEEQEMRARVQEMHAKVVESESRVPLAFAKALEEGRITAVSYTHLTLPTIHVECRSRWSPYH